LGSGVRFVLVFGFILSFFNEDLFALVAKNSSEAWLRFEYRLEISSETKPKADYVREKINHQLLYLFGTMAANPKYGVPIGQHTISIQSIERKAGSEDVFVANYGYEGLVHLKKGPLKNYQVILPRMIDQSILFADGFVGSKNRCTDPHYFDFEDYWYYFNPGQDGCPLVEKVHYDRIDARIERIPNSKRTYPEYNRLPSDETGELNIYAFIGLDDYTHSRNPMKGKDLNAFAYRKIKARLIELGFEFERLNPVEMSRILKKRKFRRPYVEVFTKQAERAPLRVYLYFGPTGIDEPSNAFHYFYKEANEKASMIVFDGHSGLGGNLDFKAIEELQGFKFNHAPKQYQIFYFNSCTSYAYYNAVYFYRKSRNNVRNRTKNLDVLTNGLGTDFDGEQIANLALIEAVVSWASGGDILSYQELADVMDTDNLFAVSGDEDNPEYERDVL